MKAQYWGSVNSFNYWAEEKDPTEYWGVIFFYPTYFREQLESIARSCIEWYDYLCDCSLNEGFLIMEFYQEYWRTHCRILIDRNESNIFRTKAGMYNSEEFWSFLTKNKDSLIDLSFENVVNLDYFKPQEGDLVSLYQATFAPVSIDKLVSILNSCIEHWDLLLSSNLNWDKRSLLENYINLKFKEEINDCGQVVIYDILITRLYTLPTKKILSIIKALKSENKVRG